jgi:hypothetical protein
MGLNVGLAIFVALAFIFLSALPFHAGRVAAQAAENSTENLTTTSSVETTIYVKTKQPTQTLCIFECCENETAYQDKRCQIGKDCINNTCQLRRTFIPTVDPLMVFIPVGILGLGITATIVYFVINVQMKIEEKERQRNDVRPLMSEVQGKIEDMRIRGYDIEPAQKEYMAAEAAWQQGMRESARLHAKKAKDILENIFR